MTRRAGRPVARGGEFRRARAAFVARSARMSEDLTLSRLVELLPPRIWYLTSNGTDMWCRRPYGFLFSTGQDAESFAKAMGTGEQLFAIGVDAGAMISDEMLAGLRASAVTRLFIDPAIDPESGDVHGKILRLAPLT
jgi:hypothetical protein